MYQMVWSEYKLIKWMNAIYSYKNIRYKIFKRQTHIYVCLYIYRYLYNIIYSLKKYNCTLSVFFYNLFTLNILLNEGYLYINILYIYFIYIYT